MTKTNGKVWTTGALGLIVLAALSMTAVGFRQNGVDHVAIAKDLSNAAVKCVEETGKDRARISALESAIFRIDDKLDDIKDKVDEL